MNRSPILLMTLALALAAPASQTFAAVAKRTKAAPPPPVELPVLSDAQLAVAPDVLQGAAQCEYHQIVSISAEPDHAGYFKLQFGKLSYDMAPEPTSTGAVRLEDKAAGVMWLQIPSKSMLMNAKIGQRMVDECQLPTQVEYANAPTLPTPVSVPAVTAAAASITIPATVGQ